LNDFDETNTVVENECENEFNLLDSEAETGQDFGLQSLIKIPSPMSETKAMLESVEMTSLQNDAGSPKSRVNDSADKTSPKSSKQSFYLSQKNSISEQILSSRVEKFDSGQVSGRILYSPESDSDSSDNKQSSLRNSILVAEAPES
jgi:hypothetical protein